jgi:hypothetical protein
MHCNGISPARKFSASKHLPSSTFHN